MLIPVAIAASLIALPRTVSWMWWRRAMPVLGSIARREAGNTYCQRQSFAAPGSQVVVVLAPDARQMGGERLAQALGQRHLAILVAFPASDHHLVIIEVDVLDPKPHTLHESDSGAIHQPRHQSCHPFHPAQQPPDLVRRQRLVRTGVRSDLSDRSFEHPCKEEHQRVEGLPLSRSGDLAVYCQIL